MPESGQINALVNARKVPYLPTHHVCARNDAYTLAAGFFNERAQPGEVRSSLGSRLLLPWFQGLLGQIGSLC